MAPKLADKVSRFASTIKNVYVEHVKMINLQTKALTVSCNHWKHKEELNQCSVQTYNPIERPQCLKRKRRHVIVKSLLAG